ncbi:MAG: DUF2183 domain-containing protein [Anaerolineae bacterium]|nr:DUF2183 domain-containing protein [Anaerolineae bacterium]
MSSVRRRLLRALVAVEDRYDATKFRLRQRRGLGALLIMPFVGYGTPDTLILKGRVLRDKRIREPMASASPLSNVVDMYKRFQSDEIPGATVQATFGGCTETTTTNVEGYFEFRLQPGALPPSDDHIYLIGLEIVDYPGKALNPAEPAEFTAQGQVIVPPPDAEFGVISDIDDTVLRSNVTDIFSLLRNTFLENAHTRLPFEGVAKLYQALRRGSSGARFNPIFYVSSSAWNLYDLLHDFFVVREIPLGALFLSDYGLDEKVFIIESRQRHKTAAIETILKTYPDLSFVLIGDSGEKDPLIYREIARRFPERIRAIYIRAASASRRRDARTRAIVNEVQTLGVPVLLVKDSYAAALHAAEIGLIHPDALATIREERDADEQAPTPLEQALDLPPSGRQA